MSLQLFIWDYLEFSVRSFASQEERVEYFLKKSAEEGDHFHWRVHRCPSIGNLNSDNPESSNDAMRNSATFNCQEIHFNILDGSTQRS